MASYHLTDALGSVRGMTDGSGALVGTADYAAFGAVRSGSGAGSVFGYTGEQTDATGLTYLRARYLDPSLGRFLSMDTVQPNAPGSQGYNRCAYVANNPVNWTDPTGNATNVDYCEMAAWGLGGVVSAGVMGMIMAKHSRGAYYIQIVALYGFGVGLAAGVGGLFPDVLPGYLWLAQRVIELGALQLILRVAGIPHMSLPTALGILLAGVLLLLVAVILDAIARAIQFILNYPRALCEWADGQGYLPPTSKGSASPTRSDIRSAHGASSDVPQLPSVAIPKPHRTNPPIPHP